MATLQAMGFGATECERAYEQARGRGKDRIQNAVNVLLRPGSVTEELGQAEEVESSGSQARVYSPGGTSDAELSSPRHKRLALTHHHPTAHRLFAADMPTRVLPTSTG